MFFVSGQWCSIAAQGFAVQDIVAQDITTQNSAAGLSPQRIPSQTRNISLVSNTEFLRDASRRMTLAEVTHPKNVYRFQPYTSLSSGALVFGWTSDAIWLRTKLRAVDSAEAVSWLLDVGFMSLDSVSLFLHVGEQGAWKELHSGGSVPFAERQERYARVLFPITLPANDSILTMYLRVTSVNSIYLNMLLVEKTAFEQRLDGHDALILLMLGIMVSAFLYNTVMFIWMRDKLYGYYIFYTGSVIISYGTIHGLLLKHFFPWAAPSAGTIISFFLCLTYIGALLFSKEFLSLRRLAPLLERLMVWFSLLIAVFIPLIVVFPSFGWVLPVFSTAGNILMLISALFAIGKGLEQAKFYVVAWSMFFVGATYFGMVSTGVVITDTTPVFTILTASTAFELTMFSFILAYRFRRMRNDAQIAERERQFAEQQRELERRKNEELSHTQHLLEKSLLEAEHSNTELLSEKQRTEDLNTQLTIINKAKNDILAIVSHDLRNPLTSIRGLTEMLQNNDLSQEKRVQVISQIMLNSDRMLELVKNLLDIELLEARGLNVQCVPFSILPLVENVVGYYITSAKAKDIRISLQAEIPDLIATANEQALIQVIDNLISNAVKYSAQGKNILVRVKAHNEWVRLEVQDEGPGISEEDMKKLFGKFARLSAQPTGGEHSTGLGLSIVKKMVEAMNGRVWCESELGKGATFIVELPTNSDYIASRSML